MHAQAMLGAHGPRLPQKLGDGVLRGFGDTASAWAGLELLPLECVQKRSGERE
jgi:hypothetical protein